MEIVPVVARPFCLALPGVLLNYVLRRIKETYVKLLRKSTSQHACCTMSMYEGHKMLLRARKNEINVLSKSGFLVELRI